MLSFALFYRTSRLAHKSINFGASNIFPIEGTIGYLLYLVTALYFFLYYVRRKSIVMTHTTGRSSWWWIYVNISSFFKYVSPISSYKTASFSMPGMECALWFSFMGLSFETNYLSYHPSIIPSCSVIGNPSCFTGTWAWPNSSVCSGTRHWSSF